MSPHALAVRLHLDIRGREGLSELPPRPQVQEVMRQNLVLGGSDGRLRTQGWQVRGLRGEGECLLGSPRNVSCLGSSELASGQSRYLGLERKAVPQLAWNPSPPQLNPTVVRKLRGSPCLCVQKSPVQNKQACCYPGSSWRSSGKHARVQPPPGAQPAPSPTPANHVARALARCCFSLGISPLLFQEWSGTLPGAL